VDSSVAYRAERDQIQLGIIAGAAAELLVVNFQIRHRAARLTAPTITTQYLLAELLIGQGIQA
jgi:hypothetical protein